MKNGLAGNGKSAVSGRFPVTGETHSELIRLHVQTSGLFQGAQPVAQSVAPFETAFTA